MSDIGKKFIPFGNYRPDPPDYDNPEVHDLDNVAPLFGTYQLIPKLSDRVPSAGTTDPVTGAYVHLFTQDRSFVPLFPSEDVSIASYRQEDSDTTDLFESLQEFNRDSYIVVDEPTTQIYRCKIEAPAGSTLDGATWGFHAFFRTIGVDSWEIKFRLFDTSTATEVFEQIISGTSDEPEGDFLYTLTAPEIALISDTDALEIELESTASNASPAISIMSSEFNSSNSGRFGPYLSTNANPRIDNVNADDSEGMVSTLSGGQGGGANVTFNVSPTITKGPANVVARTRTQVFEQDGGAALTQRVTIGEIGGHAEGRGLGAPASPTLLDVIYDSNPSTGFAEGEEIDFAQIITSFGSAANLSNGDFCRTELVQLFESPTVTFDSVLLSNTGATVNSLDEIQVFTGKFTSLQQADINGDLPDINTGLVAGDAWYFTAFGENVLATNFREEVQVKAPGDAAFSPLFTTPSGTKPKGRYIATAYGHVMIGDINFDGIPAGQANEVWWAGLNRPDEIEVSRATGADRQVMYHTRGRVTGLVGGDAMLVFKPQSVLRMDYVGGSVIWTINVLSRGVGTSYPKSIVQVGQDTYWFTGSDFARIKDYRFFEYIGDSVITKSITDSIFGTIVVSPGNFQTIGELENVIIGGYDDYSELIWWLYRSKGDPVTFDRYTHDSVVLYNPRENRWSRGRLVGDFLSQIVSFPSTGAEFASVHRGVRAIARNGEDGASFVSRFTGPVNYSSRITTKIFSSETFRGQDRKARNIAVTGIRPIFRTELATALPPTTKITVFTSETPQMTDLATNETLAAGVNRDGWFPFDVQGEFFRVVVEIPEAADDSISSFAGFEYMYRLAGRR